MGRLQDAPFPRGGTYFNGNFVTVPTPDTNEFLGGFNYEGKEYWIEDNDSPGGGYGTGMFVKVRVVRNSTAANILPGQLVQLDATSRVLDSATVLPGTNVNTIIRTTAVYGYPADEYLPAAGVISGDLFYVVIGGPCLMKTALTGTVTLVIDQKVVSGTMAGTTSADAGNVVAQDLTGATATLGAQIQNAVGRAMSAMSSQGTGQPILVNVGA
jgi:hypothetical protein